MPKIYDYIIVGSGFGGSVSALRLAEKGYSVLVIEQGKRYQTEDFPKSNWNLRKYFWFPKLALYGIQANAYLIDAVIAISVIYKGFDNLGGFEKWFKVARPNLLAMVFGFGLIHGFGLSTRVQDIGLPEHGPVAPSLRHLAP